MTKKNINTFNYFLQNKAAILIMNERVPLLKGNVLRGEYFRKCMLVINYTLYKHETENKVHHLK